MSTQPPASGRLTHLDHDGVARMVDVGGKDVTERTARARAVVEVAPGTARRVADGDLPKGDAIAVSRIAGIQAAKRTHELIPLCHQLKLTQVDVDVAIDVAAGRLTVETIARATDRTGVEMEALVAASVAALTLYDLVKAVERGAVIREVRLLEKTGGTGGDYRASHDPDRS